MLKRSFVVLFFLWSISAGPAMAEPVTIAGINWELGNLDSIQNEIESKDYTCKESPFSEKWQNCENGDKKISLGNLSNQPDVIHFYCEVFSGCNYHLEEVAQFVVDNFSIENMQFVPDYDGPNKYDGRGPEGQRIVVIEHITKDEVFIQLYKGDLGQGGMSFE